MKWQCPRCGTDLTDLVLGGKVVLSGKGKEDGSSGRSEGEVQCPSCARLVNPLIFLTNCREAARISWSVAGGSKLKRVLMFLHIFNVSSGQIFQASLQCSYREIEFMLDYFPALSVAGISTMRGEPRETRASLTPQSTTTSETNIHSDLRRRVRKG